MKLKLSGNIIYNSFHLCSINISWFDLFLIETSILCVISAPKIVVVAASTFEFAVYWETKLKVKVTCKVSYCFWGQRCKKTTANFYKPNGYDDHFQEKIHMILICLYWLISTCKLHCIHISSWDRSYSEPICFGFCIFSCVFWFFNFLLAKLISNLFYEPTPISFLILDSLQNITKLWLTINCLKR